MRRIFIILMLIGGVVYGQNNPVKTPRITADTIKLTLLNGLPSHPITGLKLTYWQTKLTGTDSTAHWNIIDARDTAGMLAASKFDSVKFVRLGGRATGQTINGGTAANDDLTLNGTSHATKTTSYVNLQTTGGNAGVRGTTPNARFTIADTTNNSAINIINYTGGLTVGNSKSTFPTYSLIKMPVAGSGTSNPAVEDGTYIQSIQTANNVNNLAFGRYNSGGAIVEFGRWLSSGYFGSGTAEPVSFVEFQNGLTTTGSVLTLGTKEPTVVANNVLGRLNFYAPLESDGSDAVLRAASIVAVAEGTFSTTNNATSLHLQTGNSEVSTTKMVLTSAGNVGIGTTAPTAVLHLKAGTASATTAPLKFTSGTNLSTTEAGAIEYDGTNLYYTATNGGARFTLNQTAGIGLLPTGTEGQSLYNNDGTWTAYSGVYWDDANSRLGIGTTSPGTNLDILGVNKSAQSSYGNLNVSASNTQAIDIGGSITLGGKYTDAGGYAYFAGIKTGKMTSMSGDYEAYLTFSTSRVNIGLAEAMRILPNGNIGIGITAPTAVLHLKAGTATASTAPLKFTSGTLLGTPEAGVVEFLTDKWYGTITSGTARKTFAFLESPVFTGVVETPAIKITTGASAGLFLMSDGSGNASWETVTGATYKGEVDGDDGKPVAGGSALIDGTGTAGWYYACSDAGTYDYGNPSGNSITLAIGDQLYYTGSVWLKIPGAGSYTLPTMSESVKGGSKVGKSLYMTGEVLNIKNSDKGDITTSVDTVWQIDNDAVTYAKIQNVSAQWKVLGRSSSGAGDVEELSMNGTGDVLGDISPEVSDSIRVQPDDFGSDWVNSTAAPAKKDLYNKFKTITDSLSGMNTGDQDLSGIRDSLFYLYNAVYPVTQRIEISGEDHYLVLEDGTPFFWLGDTGWWIFDRLTYTEADTYFNDRVSKGYNVIQAVIPGYTPDSTQPTNRNGAIAWNGGDPSDPNESYFSFVDSIVSLAQSKGLYMALLPTWGNKVTPMPDAFGDDDYVAFDSTKASDYGKFLGDRYAAYNNIVWVMGGDRPPKFTPGDCDLSYDPADGLTVWGALASGIKSEDATVLVTYHPWTGCYLESPTATIRDSSWLDFTGIQSGHSLNYKGAWTNIAIDYASSPTKPVINLEPVYEDNWIPSGGGSRFTAYDVRKASYRSVFSGSAGIAYGNPNIYQFYNGLQPAYDAADEYWTTAKDAPGAYQMGYLKRLVESRPMNRRIPGANGDLFTFAAQDDTSKTVMGYRDSTETYLMLYMPDGGEIDVNTAYLSEDTINVWWFKPADATTTVIGKMYNDGSTNITSPTTGEDWVLVMENKDIYAPFIPEDEIPEFVQSNIFPDGILSVESGDGNNGNFPIWSLSNSYWNEVAIKHIGADDAIKINKMKLVVSTGDTLYSRPNYRKQLHLTFSEYNNTYQYTGITSQVYANATLPPLGMMTAYCTPTGNYISFGYGNAEPVTGDTSALSPATWLLFYTSPNLTTDGHADTIRLSINPSGYLGVYTRKQQSRFDVRSPDYYNTIRMSYSKEDLTTQYTGLVSQSYYYTGKPFGLIGGFGNDVTNTANIGYGNGSNADGAMAIDFYTSATRTGTSVKKMGIDQYGLDVMSQEPYYSMRLSYDKTNNTAQYTGITSQAYTGKPFGLIGSFAGSTVNAVNIGYGNGSWTNPATYISFYTAPTIGGTAFSSMNIYSTGRISMRDDLTNMNTGAAAQLFISGTDTTSRLNLGYNTSTNKGFIEAVSVGSQWRELALQPTSGIVTINGVPIGGIGSIVTISKELSNAQIKAWHTTPVDIGIPAPGAGYAIEVISANISWVYGGAAWTVVSSPAVVVIGNAAVPNAQYTYSYTSGAGTSTMYTIMDRLTGGQLYSNDILEVWSGSQWSTSTTGTAKITVTYRITTL